MGYSGRKQPLRGWTSLIRCDYIPTDSEAFKKYRQSTFRKDTSNSPGKKKGKELLGGKEWRLE